MKVTRRFWIGFLVLSLGWLVLCGPASAKRTANVIPPNAKVGGLSYGEWAARWWQWAFSIPVHAGHTAEGVPSGPILNPLYDTTGEQAGVGQSGDVWFLAGVFGTSGSVTRTVDIPADKYLFFPIVNVYNNNVTGSFTAYSMEELRDMLSPILDHATNLAAELDSRPIANVRDFRVHAPVFMVTMPDDNISGSPFPLPGMVSSPFVDDGYYLMVPPLSPGKHVLHFHGTLPDFGGFTVDITYKLTVAPGGRSPED